VSDDDHPQTALAPRPPTALAAAPPEPTAAVKETLPALLEAAVGAFGDVVQALLTDLSDTDASMKALGWLATTPTLLHDEHRYSAALSQLRWWDQFLARLPYPNVLADQQAGEREKITRLRRRAVLQAQDQARQDHARLVALELKEEAETPEQVTALTRILDDPAPHEWRVDPEDYVQTALARVPQPAPLVPITAADLDPVQHFSGFTAAQAMRADPDLGPRAVALDQSIFTILRERMGLDRPTAEAHARLLTDMFWLALRRALQAGSHQLAVSIRFVADAQEDPVQAQFTRELLQSWLAVVETLEPKKKRSLWARLTRKDP